MNCHTDKQINPVSSDSPALNINRPFPLSGPLTQLPPLAPPVYPPWGLSFSLFVEWSLFQLLVHFQCREQNSNALLDTVTSSEHYSTMHFGRVSMEDSHSIIWIWINSVEHHALSQGLKFIVSKKLCVEWITPGKTTVHRSCAPVFMFGRPAPWYIRCVRDVFPWCCSK